MSYANPQSTIKLFNVPWGKNDKNFKMFDSRSTQTTRFEEYISGLTKKYEGTEFNIVKDGMIKIPVCSYNVNKYNYMMFSNPDVSSSRTYWYAFIDRVEWGSYNTAHVYYTLDAWQNYQFDITFKDCFIERMHISVTEDNANFMKYTAPEPVGFPLECTKEIGEQSADWNPSWNLNTVSSFGTAVGSTYPFSYGGYGQGTSEATGGFIWPLRYFDRASLDQFIGIYRDTALFQQSHLDEVINLIAVPKWVEDDAISHGYIGLDTYNEHHVYKSNSACYADEILNNYDQKKLACGYNPRNKKLYTSLANVIVVSNINGFLRAFKPELFNFTYDNNGNPVETLKCTWSTKPINCSTIVGHFYPVYLAPDSEAYMKLPYGATQSIGYNSNQGLSGLMNKITSIAGAGLSVASTAGSIGTGNVAGAVASGFSTLQSIGSAINAFDSVYKQMGSCSDVFSITSGNIKPFYAYGSPTKEHCEIIDNYLDVYGYAVNKRMNPDDAISTRPSWNYIKVAKLDARIDAPDDMASVIRNAFESGCHIWHGYIQNVGDFSGNNR